MGTEKHYLTFSRCALNSIMLEPQHTTGCDKLCSSCFRDMPQQTGILSKKLLCILLVSVFKMCPQRKCSKQDERFKTLKSKEVR